VTANYAVVQRMLESKDIAMWTRLVVALLSAGSLLTGCGGGGGGSSPVKSVPFTSFSAIQSGQTVQATGMSQTATGTRDPGSTPPGLATSVTANPLDTAHSSAQLSYGTVPTMTAFSFSTPQSTESFSGANVQCMPHSGVCGGGNANTLAAVINPLDPAAPALAWNYQSFGYWLSFPTNTTLAAGAISFGNVTPVTGIPTSGTATYQGLSSGGYIDPSGAAFVHAAQMTSNVDFGARSLAFSTNNTTISPINSAAATPNPALNLSGTLTYAAGSNQFTGPVTTSGSVSDPAMAGNATGRFYGPNAEEMGGVFAVKGTGPQGMLGGFGGKR
jgi:transferrin binding protein